jgi:hypothetical protein
VGVCFRVYLTQVTSSRPFKTSLLENIPSKGFVVQEEPHEEFFFCWAFELPNFSTTKIVALHCPPELVLCTQFSAHSFHGIQGPNKLISSSVKFTKDFKGFEYNSPK